MICAPAPGPCAIIWSKSTAGYGLSRSSSEKNSVWSSSRRVSAQVSRFGSLSPTRVSAQETRLSTQESANVTSAESEEWGLFAESTRVLLALVCKVSLQDWKLAVSVYVASAASLSHLLGCSFPHCPHSCSS